MLSMLSRVALRSVSHVSSARGFATSQAHLASTLVFLEHKKGVFNAAALSALTAAQQIGGDVDGFVVAKEGEVKDVADKASKLAGLKKVHFSKHDEFANHLSEPLAPLLKKLVEDKSYTHVCTGHTAVGRDIFPRMAALLDTSQVSDIIAIEGEDVFVRPIYAGNAIATIKSTDKVKVFTVRGTAFDAAATDGGSASTEEYSADGVETMTKFIEEKVSESSRPDLATAPRVVSGGRALKSAENFVKYIEPLADQLNAAVGASRAAVDAGYADNALQVGQTGKIIAPELYMAIGISGAIQHLAGMKDSKTIVAINKDADAPIFQVADLGLVADLYEAVPEMLEKLK